MKCSVGRIRRDDSLENTFTMVYIKSNLLKGAALNAVPSIGTSYAFKRSELK